MRHPLSVAEGGHEHVGARAQQCVAGEESDASVPPSSAGSGSEVVVDHTILEELGNWIKPDYFTSGVTRIASWHQATFVTCTDAN